MQLSITVPNRLTIQDCALQLAYFIGQIEAVVAIIDPDNKMRRIGIVYDYSQNTLTTTTTFETSNEYQELMILDLALLLDFNVNLLAARMFGCYVANDRVASANESPTMIVDYRNDR